MAWAVWHTITNQLKIVNPFLWDATRRLQSNIPLHISLTSLFCIAMCSGALGVVQPSAPLMGGLECSPYLMQPKSAGVANIYLLLFSFSYTVSGWSRLKTISAILCSLTLQQGWEQTSEVGVIVSYLLQPLSQWISILSGSEEYAAKSSIHLLLLVKNFCLWSGPEFYISSER